MLHVIVYDYVHLLCDSVSVCLCVVCRSHDDRFYVVRWELKVKLFLFLWGCKDIAPFIINLGHDKVSGQCKAPAIHTQCPLNRDLLRLHPFPPMCRYASTLSPLRWHFPAAKVCWHGIVWAKEDVCLLCYTSQKLSAFNTWFTDFILQKSSPGI